MESDFTDTRPTTRPSPIRRRRATTFTGGINAAGTAYCVSGYNAKGSRSASGNEYVYDQRQGGLQASTVLACQAGYSTPR